MPKYSRMQRYQGLRDRLEEETTIATQSTDNQSLQRLSRVANKESNTTFSHANNPRRSKEEEPVHTLSSDLPKSPVMDDLIDEVRQYNLEAGNSVWDQTQVSLLKQLDGNQAKRRSQHFVPMEEHEEELGSTMQLPVSKIKQTAEKTIEQTVSDEDDGPTILPMREVPLPVHPIEPETEAIPEEPENEEEKLEEEETQSPAEESSDNKIVLSKDDFISDDIEETFESLGSNKEQYKRPGLSDSAKPSHTPKPNKSQPVQKKVGFFERFVQNKQSKPRKAPELEKNSIKKDIETDKKTNEQNKVVKTAPKSTEQPKNTNDQNKNTAGKILNIILAVLIILLFVAIIATILMMRSLAA